MNTEPLIRLSNLTKRFQGAEILSGFDLTIDDGEFFTILGPSGCGKTTILRLIAGFERADEGSIYVDGQNLTDTPAEKRPINTVFQSYALFPHLTVYENVAFGLKMAKVPKADIPARVEEALAMVRLDGFAKRKPDQLSGGQRQRVAIARAVVNKPKVLLLDESFSALDYKLRLQMQIELKQLQRRLGITFVYVTHDQEEALSMSDRILVMENGMPMQVGTPRQIYEAPDNLFVAKFIGEINIFDAIIEEELPSYKYKVTLINETYKQTPTEELHTINIATDRRFDIGTKVHILLRPEDLRIEYLKYAGERPGFLGNVLERNYTGKTLDSLIELDSGLKIKASEFFDEDDPDFDYSINERVWVDWVHGWEHVIAAE